MGRRTKNITEYRQTGGDGDNINGDGDGVGRDGYKIYSTVSSSSLESWWLGCRYLAGELSRPCAQSVYDCDPLSEQNVRYGSANHANSALHPSRVGI